MGSDSSSASNPLFKNVVCVYGYHTVCACQALKANIICHNKTIATVPPTWQHTTSFLHGSTVHIQCLYSVKKWNNWDIVKKLRYFIAAVSGCRHIVSIQIKVSTYSKCCSSRWAVTYILLCFICKCRLHMHMYEYDDDLYCMYSN